MWTTSSNHAASADWVANEYGWPCIVNEIETEPGAPFWQGTGPSGFDRAVRAAGSGTDGARGDVSLVL